MTVATVQEIVRQIRRLPQKERARLEAALARLEEAEWRTAATEARRAARRRGITQADIDRAVHEVRYRDR